MMQTMKGYLGTYASPESLGIYQFTLNPETGELSKPELYYTAADSKYLSLYQHNLAAPIRQDGKAGVCLLDIRNSSSQLTGSTYQETSAACYVIQDNNFIYTANYHEGNILIYSKKEGKPELVKRIEIAPKAGCHQILFHSHYMMVPCLLLDKIMIFDCDNDYRPAGELLYSKGTGPRHGVFDQKHQRFYLVSELSNELYTYQVLEDSQFQLEQVCPLLPDGTEYEEAPSSAAVRLSPDERFLYVSTRFAELITVFKLEGNHAECIQQTSCGGRHPRDFILTPDGSYLLAVNRTEGGLVCFRINRESGKLEGMCSRVPAPEAVCVVLEGTIAMKAKESL